MKIDENTIIQCKNLEQINDCLNKLGELGYNHTNYSEDNCSHVKSKFVFYKRSFEGFDANENLCINVRNQIIQYKTFLRLYNKKMNKETKLKIIVDKNGKILQKDYLKNLKDEIFYYNTEKNIVDGVPASSLFVDERFDNIDFYISKEACEKAIKRKKIENKLRLLAFELNGNRNIDFNDNEWKNFIYYDCGQELIKTAQALDETDMNICCYSEQFKDEAIKLIGEEDLKNYLIKN